MRRRSSFSPFLSNDYSLCPSEQFNSGRCVYRITGPSLSDGGPFIFTDSDFIDCRVTESDSYGGAINCISGDLSLKRCTFIECSAGYRGGAVSFKSSGSCAQEDNLYLRCSAGHASGAFDSFEPPNQPTHSHMRCRYISITSRYHAHLSIEYSPDSLIHSNVYVGGESDGYADAGTVVNYHSTGSIVYSNCLFCNGKAPYSGGLSFMSFYANWVVTYSAKFCFFSNNYNTDDLPYEIYFDRNTSSYAKENLIIQCLSITPNSEVFLQGSSSPHNNWLTFKLYIIFKPYRDNCLHSFYQSTLH